MIDRKTNRTARHNQLQTRMALAFTLLSVFVSAALVLAVYLAARSYLRQTARERLRDIAAITALQIDAQAHTTLTDPADEGNETYQRIQRTLQRIRDRGTDIRYIYTMRQDEEGRILFVVDAESDPENVSHLGDVYSDAGPLLTERFATLDEAAVEESFYTDQWGTWLTAYAPFYTSDGQRAGVVGVDVEAGRVLVRERGLLTIALALLGLMVPIAAGLGLLMGRRLASPLMELAAGAQRIAEGDLKHEVVVRSRDEFGQLAEAFNVMTTRLQSMIGQLEQRVQTRTRDLEQRTAQLQVVAGVARDATTARNLDDLLEQTVQLSLERFSFSYTAVFLLDEWGEYAVMQAHAGDTDRPALEQGYRMKVGKENLVGSAAAEGEPQSASPREGDREPINAYPKLALPLQTGERVIGVLYIEGREGHIFSEDNVAVLQTLADQIAAAIENVRLLERMQATMQELEVASGQYTQEAWQTLARTRTRSQGYRYRRMGTEPVSEQHPEAQQAWIEGRPVVTTTSQMNDEGETEEEMHAAAVPIRLRDQIIGVFNLRSSETPISSEALALVEEIAGRLALSLESARLLEETRQRAARERLTREITDRMRRAVSVDRIVQTTVDELHRALGTDRAFVRLGATPPDEDVPADDNGKGKRES